MRHTKLIIAVLVMCPTLISAGQDRSSAPSTSFTVYLPGQPSLRMDLDREYSVIPATGTQQTDCVVYTLNPKDQQSSLVISVGEHCFYSPDAELAKRPGFTAITRELGVIAVQRVVWRRWSDAYNLYSSDCAVRLVPVDALTNSTTYRVKLRTVANTSGRRKVLEERLSSIQLFLKSETK